MDLSADFKEYQERVTSSLVNVTRSAAQLSNQDLSFHRSSSEKFSQSFNSQNAHLLRLTNKLLKAATKESNIKAPNLQDTDDVDDQWRTVIDVVDHLLEKADASLDEFTGVIKRLSPVPNDVARTSPKPSKLARTANGYSRTIPQKPQLSFHRKPNNYETDAFKPLLKSKPHAIVPLEQSFATGKNASIHPYAHEIEESIYPDFVYETSPPIPFSSPNESQAICVDTEEGVQEMLRELKLAREIAIDLEHNDRRSYIGLVCLMQISTREKDWIIDTLKPWRENLQVLNEVFTDPKILKVFHGSSMDMIWLQRDLGLYVVGLFDTYHACCALQFPGRGLKYLLQRFADFEAQKQYQTADWRVRPLPAELIDYARSDTHYLLNIYDNLRNMLLEASTPSENLIDQILTKSKAEALQVYERPLYDWDHGTGHLGWFNLLMQRPARFDKEQFGVFRAIHEWRDKKARALDEGLSFIMPNQALWVVAEAMPLYPAALYTCCRPMPKTIAENTKEFLEVIKTGKMTGQNGLSVQQIIDEHEKKYGTYVRRWRAPKKEPESTIQGVGATLQQLTQNGEIEPKATPPRVDGSDDQPIVLRSSSSHFWGTVQPSDSNPHTGGEAANSALHAILPISLHDLSFRDAMRHELPDSMTPDVQQIQPEQTMNDVAPDQSNDAFILKELSRMGKRKGDDHHLEIQDAVDVNGHGSNLNDPGISADANELSKQQKKAGKRAKKEARESEKDAKASQPTVPFDYANAMSLLHPKPGVGSNEAQSSAVKPMNPFVKALDTKTGARRPKMAGELPGKSYTFKS